MTPLTQIGFSHRSLLYIKKSIKQNKNSQTVHPYVMFDITAHFDITNNNKISKYNKREKEVDKFTTQES